MRIAHIDLSPHIGVAEEQLVVLVEAIAAHGVAQHVLVRNPFLAKRLSVCPDVSVGPLVRSPLSACFLMPAVDIAHAHERKAINACVLLNLTRTVPFVLTHRHFSAPGGNPVSRSMFRRSAGVVCPSADIATVMLDYVADTPVDTISDAGNAGDVIDAKNGRISAERMVTEYLRVYRRTLDSLNASALLL